MPPPDPEPALKIDADEEHRRTMRALAIVAGILIVLGALALRPATVIGIHGDALAHSVGGGDLLDREQCKRVAKGRWRCSVPAPEGSNSATYTVETGAFGCWTATRNGPGEPSQEEGCINAIDVVSPF